MFADFTAGNKVAGIKANVALRRNFLLKYFLSQYEAANAQPEAKKCTALQECDATKVHVNENININNVCFAIIFILFIFRLIYC